MVSRTGAPVGPRKSANNNRLTNASDSSTAMGALYSYDANNMRLYKQDGGTARRFIQSAAMAEAEIPGTPARTRQAVENVAAYVSGWSLKKW